MTILMGTQNSENILEYFFLIIRVLKVCEYLIYVLVVLSLFLQYLKNAKSLVSSWSITPKSTQSFVNVLT
jgi:hypothetical protein